MAGQGNCSVCTRFITCGSEVGDKQLPRNVRNYFVLKTAMFVLSYFTMACAYTNLSICLPDVIRRNDGNYATIATTMSFGALSNIIIAPMLSFLTDRFPKRFNLMYAVGCANAAIAYAIQPFTSAVPAFGVLFFLMSASFEAFFSLTSPMVSAMWRKRAAFPLHVVSLGYTLGGTISPLISKSFISPDKTEENVTEANSINSNWSILGENSTPPLNNSSEPWIRSSTTDTEPPIEIPFAMFSSLLGLLCICFLCFDFVERDKIKIPEPDTDDSKTEVPEDKKKVSFLEAISPRKWAAGDFKFGLVMMLGIGIYCTCIRGLGGAVGMWGFSFATDSFLKFKKDDAAYLISVGNLVSLASRFAFAAFTLFVPIQVVMFIQVIGSIVSFAFLSFGLTSQLTFWIYICALKFLSSSVWPTLHAWTNRYITLTVPLIGWVSFLTCMSDLGVDNLIGYLLEHVSKISLMYLCLGLSSLGGLSVALLQVLAFRHGDRFQNEDGERNTDREENLELMTKTEEHSVEPANIEDPKNLYSNSIHQNNHA